MADIFLCGEQPDVEERQSNRNPRMLNAWEQAGVGSCPGIGDVFALGWQLLQMYYSLAHTQASSVRVTL